MINVDSGLGVVTSSDTIPICYLNYLVDVISEHGEDISSCLIAQGIVNNVTDSSVFELSREKYYALLAEVIDIKDIPAFGLKVGCKFSSEDFGILAYAFFSCKTLEEAIKTFFRFQSIVGAGSMFNETLTLDGENAAITVDCTHTTERLKRFEVEESFGQWIKAAQRLTEYGIDLTFSRINFSFRKTEYTDLYHEIFGCPVYFEQPSNQIVFPRKALKQSPIMANEAVSLLCLQQYETLLQTQQQQIGIVEKLRRLVISLSGNILPPEEIAKKLNVSYRTLRRRLSEEGTSLKEVCTEVRMEMAVENLTQSSLSIQEIAFVLGYADVTTFHRAFKRWSGKTPGEYRDFIQKIKAKKNT